MDGGELVTPARDLGSVPVARCAPVRPFSWRTTQRHRPGLEFLVSTGRHHGFESIAEQRLLLMLDFAGAVSEVLSQPLRLRFETLQGWRTHVPDFLVVTPHDTWLIDVRPGERIGDDDRVTFAATAEAALACGWRYEVVTGWGREALSTVEALSAQRRPLTDPLRVQPGLLEAVSQRSLPFAELAGAAAYPAVARAHLLHLIWHRRLGIDLSGPLTDRTLVWAPRTGTGDECI
ncbi:TnsA-like heteromeric transposase endonuclease subunit [Actinomadura rifamycini]|uniref:TnsA-like heteromeric transposase endonuclease subunit n=1 Tax=Actinomadura rifamycini TaxID=31962 RepID=UPI001FDFB169|nr:TnsA-like heteromeric transposase endonuclease subunit [Actinomadura rifamycini]